MKNNHLEKVTKLSFLGLALLPLLKENLNSILIITCALLTLIYNIQSKEKRKLKKELLLFTLPFWMFFLHELLSKDNNYDRVLMHLPFLIFPLIFAYKPSYIDKKWKIKSLAVFQFSVVFQCFIYLIFFVLNNPVDKLFFVRNNIPFFREYVSENYLFEIHPTYFCSFLLISFTISLFSFLQSKRTIFKITNMVVMAFFLFLISSRIVLLTLIITVVVAFIYIILKKGFKQSIFVLLGVIIVSTILVYPAREIIGKRIKEIKTEINKPIVGDYYNSTNTRIAIIKCSLILLKDVPIFGYGEELQEKLNACYKANNKSDFYLKHTFNTHNYYINLITYGGWFFFLLFIVYGLFIYKKINYSILGVVIVFQILIINLTENYFSRHYGIVMFSYITSLIIFLKEKEARE